jgi:hypothetical protein
LAFRWIRFSRIYAVTTTRIRTWERFTRPRDRALTRTQRPPIGWHSLLSVPRGIGGGLQPCLFSGPHFLANKLLRTYYRMAVSVPTFLLSSKYDAVCVSHLAHTQGPKPRSGLFPSRHSWLPRVSRLLESTVTATSEFKRPARILLPVPSELVLYITVRLVQGIPEGIFGGNQQSPY